MEERSRRPAWREIADELLMARYAHGDAEAFAELFRRYEQRVFAYFFRRTGSAERAQDLYQELFLRIHRARDRFDPARPFPAWLFQIARRLFLDDEQRAHRSHEVPLEDREPVAALANGEECLGDRELLAEALARLSGEERHVLLASKLEGVGYAELAAQLGKSVEAVRKMASRTLQRLRTSPLVAVSVRAEGRAG